MTASKGAIRLSAGTPQRAAASSSLPVYKRLVPSPHVCAYALMGQLEPFFKGES